MGPTVDALFRAAMMLSEQDRLALVSRLLDSMPSNGATISAHDPALRAELDRRFADPKGAIPWSELSSEG